MKLIDTIYELLLEAAPEEIYNKYYSDIEWSLFLRIVGLDPTTKIEGDRFKLKKIGKFGKLLIKMHKEGNLKTEDYPKVKDYLTLVYKHKVPVDITKVKTVGDLFSLVEKYYTQSDQSNVFDLLKVLDGNDYELLHSGDDWLIYHPKSEKGAAYLGVGTEWCTAWGPYSTNKNYRDRKNHFTSHNNSGWLYVMINREDPTIKYQFHFETKQFMDKNDRGIKTGEFFNDHQEITSFFYPSLFNKQGVTSEEMGRLQFLDNEVSMRLISRAIDDSENPLVQTLINTDYRERDEVDLKQFINDENVDDVTLDAVYSTINFTLNEIDGDLETVASTLSYMAYYTDRYNSYVAEDLREDVYNMDEDWKKEEFERLLKEYWDKKGNQISFTNDFKQFLEYMTDYEQEIDDDYATEYTDLNEGIVTNHAEKEENEIKTFISIDEVGRSQYEVILPITHFALYLENNDIERIEDASYLLENYVSHHNLAYEFENPIYNAALESVSLKEMEGYFDSYVEKIEEEINEAPECREQKVKLQKIKDTYFNRGYNYYSDNLRLEVYPPYDCEKGVKVSISTKEKRDDDVSNWEYWRGYITVEKLMEYVTNERLFETISDKDQE